MGIKAVLVYSRVKRISVLGYQLHKPAVRQIHNREQSALHWLLVNPTKKLGRRK
jgi:hypothetical protein|tara:strand:+ start:173 stop:334 length:162 start_codon:yes stop_codon:yes gene_type:complete